MKHVQVVYLSETADTAICSRFNSDGNLSGSTSQAGQVAFFRAGCGGNRPFELNFPRLLGEYCFSVCVLTLSTTEV